jgi:hypothetical protein
LDAATIRIADATLVAAQAKARAASLRSCHQRPRQMLQQL